MKSTKLLVLVAAGLLALAGCNKGNSDSSSAGGASSVDPSDPANLANGVFTYVNESNAERTKILGILEKYAVDEKLTGLTLFNNGGYVIYNDGIQKGTNSYIRGYGFGILAEGNITKDLEGETNAAWKRYLHSFESEDPGSLNYMNDKGSAVGDLQSYVTASYWQTKMNATKDGYDWVADLAKVDRPIAVNAQANGLATKYKFPVKVGSELKYSTTSTKYAAFNNREVALEDYVTPYKIYYTKAYGMVRGSENLTGTGSIKGASSYYNASANGFNQAKWDNIGIKAYVDGGQSYLEFEFNLPCTPFFAMYYLANGMFAPVPAEFIETIGGGNFADGTAQWGVYSEDLSESPLDHWLSTGPYMLERWDAESQIVFKKNPNYADLGRYKIQGVHLNVLAAINSDSEAAIKEFEANKLHSCGIPSTRLEQYRTDPRVTTTIGDSNFKLNLNTCTQEQWVDIFGEEDQWECEPAMSNKDFVSGLSFAIDRKSLANKLGRNPAFEYFSPTYLSDPENGVYYNDTDEHKAAVAALQNGTDGFGYSLELAKSSFKKASEKLIEDGDYKAGDTINIEIAWMYASDEDEYHSVIAKNLTDAFNTADNPLKLNVEFWVGQKWSDVYYNKLMEGQFDIGFGSISGNSYNPLNFLEVLKSDNSSGFTLNWGIDTNALNANNPIVYDGKVWTFDALWTAADQGAYVKDGKNAAVDSEFKNATAVRNADGSLTLEADFQEYVIKDDQGNELLHNYVSDIHIYDGVTDIDLPIVKADFDSYVPGADGFSHIKVTFPADVIAELDNDTTNKYAASGYLMFDVYYSLTVFGLEGAPAIAGSIYILSGIPAIGEAVPDGGLYY